MAVSDESVPLQISWIRMSDYAILSAGGSVYTTNSRYSVHMAPDLGLWTLQIRNGLVSLSH